MNLVSAQPHILHNLTGETGDTSALAPNLHQTYFEVSLRYFSFIDVDNFVVRVTALVCTRSSWTPINWRTTSIRSRSVKFKTTNQKETRASSELFLGNWGRANLPKPGAASVSLPGPASSNGTSGTHLSKSLESQRHK